MKTLDAIAAFGGRRAIARALGLARQSVYKWGENVPELRAYQIQELPQWKEWIGKKNG